MTKPVTKYALLTLIAEGSISMYYYMVIRILLIYGKLQMWTILYYSASFSDKSVSSTEAITLVW